ncbi:MAG: putative O-glycosylation ligase, exosortase A system-associated [bacterium]|nr:putative O-glycosylation ligase, exosortase A system-associated [bacterium]
MAFIFNCFNTSESNFGQSCNILSIKEWYGRFRKEWRGKYIFILFIFVLILCLKEIYFLYLGLLKGLALKYLFAGSCTLIALMWTPIRPFIGVIVYCLLAYLIPLGGFWFSRTVTLATLWGWLIWAIKNKKYRFVKATQNYLILGLWLMMLISIIFAFDKSLCWQPLETISKVFFFYFAVINLIDSKRNLKYFIWTILFIFGFLSLDVGASYLFRGITHLGGAGCGDNNLFALSLVMTIPFAFYFSFVEKSPLKKVILALLFLSMILATILTFSRGGFLGLVTVLGLIWLKTKYKLISSFTSLFLILCVLLFLPQGYKDRIHSILEYRQDGSAMGRIVAWKTGLKMIKDKPVIGVGLGNFSLLIPQYNPYAHTGIEPHNSFIQIASECGLIALLFFILLPIISIRELWQLRKKFANTQKGKWVVSMANMLEISFCGYIVSGSFLHQAHMPLFYLFIALSVVVKQIAEKEEE